MNNSILHPYSLNNSMLSNTRADESPVKLVRESVAPSLSNLIQKENKDQQQTLIQLEKNSPLYKQNSQLQLGNKKYGSSIELINSLTNPFSNNELDDNVKLTNINQNQNKIQSISNLNSSYQNNQHFHKNENQNQINDTKDKRISNLKNQQGFNVQGILKNSYEGAREGMEQRQKLFNGNQDMLNIIQSKHNIEESPQVPDNFSLQDKIQLSSALNNQGFTLDQVQNLFPQHPQQLQNNLLQQNTNRKQESIYEKTFKSGTIAYTQYKQRQKFWQKNWSKMASLISKSLYTFKKILIISKPVYLTKLQMNLINDKSAHFAKLRDNKEKRYQGWLYNNTGYFSRRSKKRILIFLKKIKVIKNFFLKLNFFIKEKINSFDQKLPPISPLTTILKIFDFLMLVFTIYIAFIIPLYICFKNELNNFQSGENSVFILKYVSPYIFMLDILKYLNTGCFFRGQIINERIQILKNYFRERFICDAISITSLFVCESDSLFNNYGALIFYYFRFYFGLNLISKIRESFLLKDKTHAAINIFILFSYIFFFAHIFACIWFFIGQKQYENNEESWLVYAQIQNKSFQVKFIDSLHFIFTCISTLDSNIMPQSQYEKIFLILMNFITFGLLGYILYESHQIFKNLSLKRKNYLKQLKQINRYMNDHNVSQHYQSLARKYLQYVTNEGLDSRQVSADKSLQGLSLQLKEDIIKDSFITQLKEIRVFSRYFSEQFLEKLALKMGEQILGPDECVINSNKLQIPKIYIVKKGVIEFFVNIGTQRTNKKDSLKSFKIFKENEYFGSYEFFSDNYKPNLSARSIGVSVVQYISLVDFLELLNEFPEEREAYCFIKEMVTIYKKLDIIGITCYSCGERDHQPLKCPYLFYDQQRTNILKKLEQETHILVRKYKRKNLHKSNCLKSCKKIHNAQEMFLNDNADWLISQSSMMSLEVEDNLQLNNLELPRMDSNNLESYFHMRGKTSSIGTLGTFLRVREDQPPGNLNNIYFDSDLDAYSMNSVYLKSNATKTMNEYEWNSFNSTNQHQQNTNAMMLTQTINNNSQIPKTPSVNSVFDEEEQTNFNSRKMQSKLTSSPSRASINPIKLPDYKHRSKSTNIKPSGGDSYIEDSNSLLDIKSISVKSPRPNTVVVPPQKSETSGLTRRNTTKTRNRGQSFKDNGTQWRDNGSQWRESTHRSTRKQYEQSLFSYQKTVNNNNGNIEEESSFIDEEEYEERSNPSQKSFSYKDYRSDRQQSRPSEKQTQYIQHQDIISNINHFANSFSTVHSFRTFFPHNNIENVLELINEKSKNLRKVQQKKLTKKNSHRSLKKQNSQRSKKGKKQKEFDDSW